MSRAAKTKPSARRAAKTSWASAPNRKKRKPRRKKCLKKAPRPRRMARKNPPKPEPLRLTHKKTRPAMAGFFVSGLHDCQHIAGIFLHQTRNHTFAFGSRLVLAHLPLAFQLGDGE